MDSVLAQLVRDRKRRFVGRICVAIQVIEPDLLLRRPHVLGADLAVGFCDSRVTDVHGLHGVGAEGYAGSDFAKGWRLFVDCYGDGAVV